jgi:DNA invertase Pin-like site-specific DNA recombinase
MNPSPAPRTLKTCIGKPTPTSPSSSRNTLAVWKLDRLGRDLRHLVNLVGDLTKRNVGLKVLSGEGASIDTTTANGRLVFAGLAEFERELISERTQAGLASARARGRKGGRRFKMTAAKLRLAQAALGKPETRIRDLCAELGITRQTLYRFVGRKENCARTPKSSLLGRRAAAPDDALRPYSPSDPATVHPCPFNVQGP